MPKLSKMSDEQILEEQQVLSKNCHNCRRPRLILHLDFQSQNQLSICVNPKCFLYSDVTKFITWIK